MSSAGWPGAETSLFQADALKGKVALVAGGSSESGPGLCRVLARHGADVALTWHTRRAQAEEVARGCRELGVRSETFAFDILEHEQVLGLVPRAVAALGGLDILVNLGGPPPVYTSLRELDEEGYRRMMDGHVRGPFFLAREAARYMEGHGGGLVVNVSATSALKYSHAAYGFAKACVVQMTRFLAGTFAPSVRVITLVPGLIDLDETDAGMRRQRAAVSPLKRIVTPEDLGLLVVAAASPAMRSVTGESLLADGGFWLLHP